MVLMEGTAAIESFQIRVAGPKTLCHRGEPNTATLSDEYGLAAPQRHMTCIWRQALALVYQRNVVAGDILDAVKRACPLCRRRNTYQAASRISPATSRAAPQTMGCVFPRKGARAVGAPRIGATHGL